MKTNIISTGRNKIHLSILLILIMVLNLMLASCGTDTKSEDTGNYFEKDIPLPEGVAVASDFYTKDNKEIIMAGFNEDGNTGTVWSSLDKGKSWEKVKTFTDGIDVKIPEEYYAEQEVALSPSGEIFYSLYLQKDEDVGKAYYYIIGDEGPKSLDIKLSQKNKPYEGFINHVAAVEFIDNGNLLVKEATNNFCAVDPKNGNIVNTYNDGASKIDYSTYAVSGDDLYLFTTKKAYALSLTDGKSVEIDKTVEGFTQNVKMLDDYEKIGRQGIYISNNEKGTESIYSINNEGIKKYDGKTTKILNDGSGTVLSLSETYVSKIGMLNDENIIIIANTNDGKIMYDYEYLPDVKKGTEEISIYMLKSKEINNASLLNRAIVMYQKKHPEVKINLEVGVSGEDAMTETDALKTLNADVLSGNGPDIIVFDDISVENFISNNMLEDISAPIEKVNKSEGLVKNVINQYNKNEEIYAVPTLFSPIVVSGKKEIIASAVSIENLASKVLDINEKNGIPAISEYSSYHLPMILYNTYLSPETLDGKSLDANTLKTFYKSYKEILDEVISIDDFKDEPYDMDNIVPQMNFFDTELIIEECQISFNYMSTMFDFEEMKANEVTGKGNYKFAGKDSLNLYAPQMILGVNSKSNQKEISKSFIEFMLTEDGQKTYDLFGQASGLYVNKTLLKRELNTLKKDIFGTEVEYSNDYIYGDEDEHNKRIVKVNIPKMTESEEKEIMNFVESVKTPVNTDYMLMNIIMEYAEDYLLGKTTLDEATDKAMQKLKIYMEE